MLKQSLLLVVIFFSFSTSLYSENVPSPRFETVRLAIQDLNVTFGDDYPMGESFLRRLNRIQNDYEKGNAQAVQQLEQLRQEALLANPLLDINGILLVKRKSVDLTGPIKALEEKGPGQQWGGKITGALEALGLPSNHECNSSLRRTGYDNEIAILSPVHPRGRLETLYTPPDSGYVGEIDLHWNAEKILFTLSDSIHWKIITYDLQNHSVRQISHAPQDVDCFDACFMPNEKIIFGSTASLQSVPCWHGQRKVSNLYVMNGDGSEMRQVCFDQDHDFHPTLLKNGQVLYNRWDYTGINHIYQRQLMVMNPDGSGQRAVYGTNSWYPNSLYFPKVLPEQDHQIICILSGYHGAHRMGQLVIVDMNKGYQNEEGLIKRISGRGDPVRPRIKDNLVDDDWPKFLHPFPLSDKYFLVSAWIEPEATWAIYLADIFDNLVLIHKIPGYALLEPVPIVKRPKPAVIPGRVNLAMNKGTVYLHDVYAGPGLKGVPRGTIEKLRILAYNFGFLGMAGPHKIGFGGPWEAMLILGTVPLKKDGSAMFKVPANTPVAVQALDSEGKAVQLMRSWFTVMPGETQSCVGCHESPYEVSANRISAAALEPPQEITPWYGPARGFDFAREVQPVLNAYCVSCHDGRLTALPDLRAEEQRPDYQGMKISTLGEQRMHPLMKSVTHGKVYYTPAYDALLPYIRRVGIEDDVKMLFPGEYHTDTSPLIQMLQKGHQGVKLDDQAWDRFITWIDLNAPCHGTWGDVFPVPDDQVKRRQELRQMYGGPALDPEVVPKTEKTMLIPSKCISLPEPNTDLMDDAETKPKFEGTIKTVRLDSSIHIDFVEIPAGWFVMGDPNGQPDEWPLSRVEIKETYWISKTEVTNEMYRLYDPDHDSRYYAKRHAVPDDMGLSLNDPDQPVVRVSWEDAIGFCNWLSQKSDLDITLPTEAQWEYACRAGHHLFASNESWPGMANLADSLFAFGRQKNRLQITGGVQHMDLEGARLADTTFCDGYRVSSPVASFKSNTFGLYDILGNVAEWTCSVYKPYPYDVTDGRDELEAPGERVVRGGSWFDPPSRARAGIRLSYPVWQRIFNVGFRVVIQNNRHASQQQHLIKTAGHIGSTL
ncbi:SUMF1/EgtB/PvdO family nonheme iron enzyme [candidate division KSB1 bacterium]|nr:SUMF1/EgtB/PvdO family nonheme iron enzyme [candidate division KSB1 bacterium]